MPQGCNNTKCIEPGSLSLYSSANLLIMIEAVVFDLGKVLVDFDYSIAAPKIAARTRMSAAELMHFFMRSPLLLQYETGLISSQDFYRGVSIGTGFDGTFDEFAGFFGDIFDPIEPMIQAHALLRQRGMPTYVFSNTNELAILHVSRCFPFYKTFDGHILSYEHKAMKPDPRLYEVVEQLSGRRGRAILYLDDRPENIAAGAARGWQVILHETPEKSRAAFERLGILDAGNPKSESPGRWPPKSETNSN
jgi:FMN phosphatase YigB (HAD superfamily)